MNLIAVTVAYAIVYAVAYVFNLCMLDLAMQAHKIQCQDFKK